VLRFRWIFCRWRSEGDAKLPACPELDSLNLCRSPFGPQILRSLCPRKLAHLSVTALDYGDKPSDLIDLLVQTGIHVTLRSLSVTAKGRIREAHKAVLVDFCMRQNIELNLY
jgi:hypothetical protein